MANWNLEFELLTKEKLMQVNPNHAKLIKEYFKFFENQRNYSKVVETNLYFYLFYYGV